MFTAELPASRKHGMYAATKQAVQQLGRAIVDRDAWFMRLDIEEFFMTGQHTDFVRVSEPLVDAHWRFQYREMLTMLLKNQFVQNGRVIYNIIQGAGMGLAFSGDLCDIL